MKKALSNVTIAAIDCVQYGLAISAIKKSLVQIEPAKALFLTDIKAFNPNFPFDIVKIDKIESKSQYSEFVIKKLAQYIETDFVLIIQHDGYVLNADAWDDEYLQYDYIGAPWLETDGYNVGNGGFSLRSKRLMDILAIDEFIKPFHPEDATICRLYRPYLEEKYGIKFAPAQLADKFSFELREPNQPTFGFHGKFHEPYRPTVVIKRSGAIGDVVMCEPVLEYFHNKGYKVVLDTPIHIALLFQSHHYPVFHISQLTDNRILVKVIDLDLSYEETPQQLHLQSYYEKAGITDGVIKNPKLNFVVGDHNRLFKKYVILHISKRDQPHRNIYGVDWQLIVINLQAKGYTVIQVGMTEQEDIPGAVQMQTVTTNLLLYLIKGAELFIGIDSGPSNIAVACGIPSVIFFGSVNPDFIIPDKSNICVIHNHEKKVCETPFCWSNVKGTTGQDCYINKDQPPCTQFYTAEVLHKIDKFVEQYGNTTKQTVQ